MAMLARRTQAALTFPLKVGDRRKSGQSQAARGTAVTDVCKTSLMFGS